MPTTLTWRAEETDVDCRGRVKITNWEGSERCEFSDLDNIDIPASSSFIINRPGKARLRETFERLAPPVTNKLKTRNSPASRCHEPHVLSVLLCGLRKHTVPYNLNLYIITGLPRYSRDEHRNEES